jgi:hypothetical protein
MTVKQPIQVGTQHGFVLVTRLGVCYDRGLTEPALYASGSTCNYNGNPFFLVYPYPLPQQQSASGGFDKW